MRRNGRARRSVYGSLAYSMSISILVLSLIFPIVRSHTRMRNKVNVCASFFSLASFLSRFFLTKLLDSIQFTKYFCQQRNVRRRLAFGMVAFAMHCRNRCSVRCVCVHLSTIDVKTEPVCHNDSKAFPTRFCQVQNTELSLIASQNVSEN